MKTPAAPSRSRIGTLAAQTGCSVPTIRYYEEVGLIPPAQRSESGHRVYDADAARLLGFIRRCRDSGFSIEQVRAFLEISESGTDCAEARDLAKEQLRSVRAKMLELMDLERTLLRFVDTCDATCAGGPVPSCSIMRELGR